MTHTFYHWTLDLPPNLVMDSSAARKKLISFCQTPNLVLGLGVDFTFPYNKNNNKNKNNNNKNNKNPHLIFHRREGTRGLKIWHTD